MKRPCELAKKSWGHRNRRFYCLRNRGKLIVKVSNDNVIEKPEICKVVQKGKYERSACEVAGDVDQYYLAMGLFSLSIAVGDNLWTSGSSTSSSWTLPMTDCRASPSELTLNRLLLWGTCLNTCSRDGMRATIATKSSGLVSQKSMSRDSTRSPLLEKSVLVTLVEREQH